VARNGSFTYFDRLTKIIISIAANRTEMVTFFKDLLLHAKRTERIRADTWKAAEVEYGIDEDRQSRINSDMYNILDIVWRVLTILKFLRIIQSPTRCYLAYESKRHIATLYRFNQNCSPEYIRKQVSYVMDKNRFTY